MTRDLVYDPSLVLHLPLHQLDGASIMSQDAYGHLCTVTGALWTPRGRFFDMVDDLITVPAFPSINNIWDGGGTIVAWINAASDGEANGGCIAAKSPGAAAGWTIAVRNETGDKVKLRLFHFFSGDDGFWITVAPEIDINTPTFVAVTYNSGATANNAIIYINDTAFTVGDGLTRSAPTGTRDSDAGDNLTIGNRSDTALTFDGTIGEVLGYNRVLTPLEIQQIYLATKWRYR